MQASPGFRFCDAVLRRFFPFLLFNSLLMGARLYIKALQQRQSAARHEHRAQLRAERRLTAWVHARQGNWRKWIMMRDRRPNLKQVRINLKSVLSVCGGRCDSAAFARCSSGYCTSEGKRLRHDECAHQRMGQDLCGVNSQRGCQRYKTGTHRYARKHMSKQ